MIYNIFLQLQISKLIDWLIDWLITGVMLGEMVKDMQLRVADILPTNMKAFIYSGVSAKIEMNGVLGHDSVGLLNWTGDNLG